MIILGDSLLELKKLDANSVDAVVTDPPYGLSFMNKKWDYDVPSIELWREVLRVLKPGGHLLSFGGTRTYHRMTVNIEDAGFDIRDQVMWIYGSGFPKSTDVSKRIDKEAGAEREVVGTHPNVAGSLGNAKTMDGGPAKVNVDLTAPSTSAAKQWQGFGSALKPANEPICLARKPLEKGLTLAGNVLKWGCGGLNIDGSRIGYANEQDAKEGRSARVSTSKGMEFFTEGEHDQFDRSDRSKIQGRWPANILFDETAAEMLDEQTKDLHGAGAKRPGGKSEQNAEGGLFGVGNHEGNGMRFGDSGGASRFFYVAKASKRERNAGLEGMPEVEKKTLGDYAMANHHPTVKPIKLMEYLCKLITPPKGTILDPFMGSGSTGVAARNLGFEFIGIEREPEYAEISERRIGHTL